MKLRLLALIAVFTLVWSNLFSFAQDQDKDADKPAARTTRKDQKKDESKSKDKDKDKEKDREKEGPSSKPSTQRRPPANVGFFVFETDSMKDTSAFGLVPNVTYCVDHAHNGCRAGFQSVSRLEQYAFLLNVALRRLYTLLKKRGVVPASPGQ